MIKVETPQTAYYKFENLSKYPEILHFISTRKGGFSKAAFEGLNLGLRTIDDRDVVLKNRQILAESVGFSLNNFCLPQQVHGEKVTVIDKNWKSKGTDFLAFTDALVTNEKNICLGVFAADCVPLLFYEPSQKIIAAVHAGWRGTVKKIAAKTVQTMAAIFNADITKILVAIGPSISVEVYEIGQEVEEAVFESFGTTQKFLKENPKTGKKHFDLWYANQYQLMEIGILESNIEISGLCTYQHSNIFFSSRKGLGLSGRFVTGIQLL